MGARETQTILRPEDQASESLPKHPICMYCLGPAEGNFSMHAFGFDDGPQLPLCDAHGEHETPTLGAIWERANGYPQAVIDMLEESARLQ